MKLLLADEAKSDLAGIYVYSRENWGVTQARAYMLSLRSVLKRLAAEQIAGVAAHGIRPGLRRQTAGSHVIWFRMEPNLLRVIRVLHQSRDAGRWMG